MTIRITCINKSGGYHQNPYVAISHLGWIEDGTGKTGKSTRLEMYELLESGVQAYVEDFFGNKAYLVTEISPAGTKFVKTKADDTKTDNLLALKECPY